MANAVAVATANLCSKLMTKPTTATVAFFSASRHLPTAFSSSKLSTKSFPPLHHKFRPKSLKSTTTFRAMTTAASSPISVGDKLPEATFSYLDDSDELQTITVSDLTKGKKAVLFAVPGAFTPTCSQKHLPGFVEKSGELKAKGVGTIACISVNDAFVMKAWKADMKIVDEVLLLSDGNGDFTRALGVTLDLSDKPVGLGVRSRRYALLAEDGIVKVLNLEEGGAFSVSSAEDMLKAL